MKFLGIDYGTKRIGISISDEEGILAFPKRIVLNNADIFKTLSEIVIGESVDFTGASNALSARIEVFILELQEKFNLPIHKQKEFLTSIEARKSKGGKKLSASQAHSRIKQKKSDHVDAHAAAIILQRYLDKKNKGKNSE